MKCLMLDSVPKTWYCPNCQTLPHFKKSRKKKEEQPINLSVMRFDTICICKAKPCTDEKLLECHGASCQSGTYFHLACLRYKKMPKNSQPTWKCPSCCKSSKVVKSSKNSNDCVVTLVKNHVQTPHEKCNPIGELTEEHFDVIRSPTGWLDCIIIHDAQTLLQNINTAVKGFQRPTLGPCGRFEIIVGDFLQILHVNGNHWVCVSSINCQPGYVNILDSL